MILKIRFLVPTRDPLNMKFPVVEPGSLNVLSISLPLHLPIKTKKQIITGLTKGNKLKVDVHFREFRR